MFPEGSGEQEEEEDGSAGGHCLIPLRLISSRFSCGWRFAQARQRRGHTAGTAPRLLAGQAKRVRACCLLLCSGGLPAQSVVSLPLAAKARGRSDRKSTSELHCVTCKPPCSM